MNDARGHRWEVRHGDLPTSLGDRQAELYCLDCKHVIYTRVIRAYRRFSFRDREALEQAWETHLAQERAKQKETAMWEREKELLPY